MITLHADRGRVDLLGLLFNLTTIVMLISFMVVILSILIMCFGRILSSLRSNTSNCSSKYCKNTTTTFYCNNWPSQLQQLSEQWCRVLWDFVVRLHCYWNIRGVCIIDLRLWGFHFQWQHRCYWMMHEQLHPDSSRGLGGPRCLKARVRLSVLSSLPNCTEAPQITTPPGSLMTILSEAIYFILDNIS